MGDSEKKAVLGAVKIIMILLLALCDVATKPPALASP